MSKTMPVLIDYQVFNELALDFETNETLNMVIFSVAGKNKNKIISGAYESNEFKTFWNLYHDKLLVFHNAKFDLTVLKTEGYDFEKVQFEDTMIMAHLLDENRRKALKELRQTVLGKPARLEWKDIDKTNIKEYLEYAEADAIDTIELYFDMKEQITAEGLETAYAIEKRVIYPTIDMGYYGCKIDVELIDFQNALLGTEIDELEKKIYKEAGYEFNLRSTKQVQKLFYEDLKYPPRKYWATKTGFSTAVGVLQVLSKDIRYSRVKLCAESLLLHRKYTKLLSAFGLSLKKKLRDNQRIYPSFNAVGTVTGRYSCSDPNLQQIPKEEFYKGDLKTHLRSLFIADKGKKLVTADYSQIELRLMAALSRDVRMCKAYVNKEDLHQVTADLLYLSRNAAKTLNFMIGYGGGPANFAESVGIAFPEAARYINNFWVKYYGLARFMDFIKKSSRIIGYVRTISGRKRRLVGGFQSSKDRQACNTVIQGSAADLMKLAMILIYDKIDNNRAKFIMTVHDEVTLEADEDYAEETRRIMKECMEGAIKFVVPIIAEPLIGNRWSENKG